MYHRLAASRIHITDNLGGKIELKMDHIYQADSRILCFVSIVLALREQSLLPNEHTATVDLRRVPSSEIGQVHASLPSGMVVSRRIASSTYYV